MEAENRSGNDFTGNILTGKESTGKELTGYNPVGEYDMKNDYTKIARDENLRETVSHGSAEYPFSCYYENVWDFDLHCIDWHWHPEVEFVYLKKGRMNVMVGPDCFDLPEGSAIFINTQVIHCFKAPEGDAIIPNIVFSPRILAAEETLIWQKYIQPILTDSAPWQLFSPDVPWQKKIIDTLKDIFTEQTGNKNEMKTCGELLGLWNILYQHTELYGKYGDIAGTENLTDRHPDSKASGISNHSISHQAQLQIMMHYIQTNYPDSLTLENIASAVNISKSSALKLFAAYLHEAPVAYLIRCRLQHAAMMLTDTEETLSVIALRTGFRDVAYFCRKFKELYRLTPTEYRKSKALKNSNFE